MEVSRVSKAIAGAVVAVIVAALAKYNITLGAEVAGALGVLIDAVAAAVIGYLVVYIAPKNRP